MRESVCRVVRVYDAKLCARACAAHMCVREGGSRAATATERAGASDASARGSERELKIKMYWAAGGFRLGREWTGR